MMGNGGRRKLPDFCFWDAVPVELVDAELLACHIECYAIYSECNNHAKIWDDLDKCEREYDDCFIKCCEKYV